MSYLDRLMQQTATHWELKNAADTPYNEYGDPSFKSAAPQLLTPDENNGVRWEEKTIQFINSQGLEDHSRAIVRSSTVEFQVGDYLYLGTSTSTNPETVTGADKVRKVEKCPDTRGQTMLYKALL